MNTRPAKQCQVCGSAERRKNGRYDRCAPCSRTAHRAWMAINNDARNARRRQRYASDPAFALANRRTASEWYGHNRQHSIDAAREWRKENPEAARAIAKRWRENNKDAVRAKVMRRRASAAMVTLAHVGKVEIAARRAMFGGRCWICGGVGEEMDHVKPVSKRGPHCPANLRPICIHCNRTKMAKWPFDTRTNRKHDL